MPPAPHRYAELHCHSHFSFLEGASSVDALVLRAQELGYAALALTDRDGVYGAPTFHTAAAGAGLKAIHGAEVTLDSGHHLTLLVQNAAGWSNLTRLLTIGRRRCKKGTSAVTFAEVAAHAEGLIALSGCERGEVAARWLAGGERAAAEVARRYRDVFGDGFYLELQDHLRAADMRRNAALEWLGRTLAIPRVATGDVHHATADGKRLHDVLTAVKAGVPLDQAGPLLFPNAERHLQPLAEIGRRFRMFPGAVLQSAEIAARCDFALDRLSYRFPAFPVPAGETPYSYLHSLVHGGARARYRPLTPKAARQIAKELDVIERMDLAGYFLIVWDIVRFAKDRGILCQGRGSAANSAVCYCLGITAVDPVGLDLLFERFLSEERKEIPDIDLDFAHREREQVIQYVYDKYGRDRAGMVCEFITYRGRSAVRDVGKSLGLSLAQVEALSGTIDAWGGSLDQLEGAVGPRARHLAERVREIESCPRHLSIHSGGMVITERPLAEVVPVENAAMDGRTVIQWDKDDLAKLGIIKIDLLALGMLTAIQDALALIRKHEGKAIDLAEIGTDDPKVYDMLCAADTVGVFQVESRAQMNTLPRLKPRNFYDLVVEVALIRPGPIQGDMVHPYLRRRAGKEKVTYPHPSLEPILKRTLGVPLFQEQGMKLAVAAAGFSAGEADELRRAMGHKRSREKMALLSERLVAGMEKNGIDKPAAETILHQLTAFADYGFPESHAASFALIVYASAWLKRYYPAAFTAGLLNAQPMGFYSPASLVNDARRHGVPVLPIDATESAFDCTLEEQAGKSGVARFALRIGMRFVRGAGESARAAFERARQERPYSSIRDFAARAGLAHAALEHLALLGGFRAFRAEPRAALWEVQALKEAPPGPLAAVRRKEAAVAFAPLTGPEQLRADYVLSGLSTERQPIQFFRARLAAKGVLRTRDLARAEDGAAVRVAGLVICRQRPPTAGGFTFLTLEDETGMANVVLTPAVGERFRAQVRSAPLLVIEGTVEREDGVVNVKAERIHALGHGSIADGVRRHDFH